MASGGLDARTTEGEALHLRNDSGSRSFGASGEDSMDKEAPDLRRIAGIGTAMERTLREAGVRTLADLADRPTDELAGIVGKPPRTVQGVAGPSTGAGRRGGAGADRKGPPTLRDVHGGGVAERGRHRPLRPR